jgi:hypothetical protein
VVAVTLGAAVIPEGVDPFRTYALVEPLLAGFSPGYYNLGDCQCRPGAVCLNATGPTGAR